MEVAREQAAAEGVTLRVAKNTTGYFGVHLSNPGYPKPFRAQVSLRGKDVHLGSFATAEEAALCVARSPEGRAAAEKAAAAPPNPRLTSEEARQQAQKDRLELVVADNKTGFFAVRLSKRSRPRPYQAQVKGLSGKYVHLGSFATAEGAALCVARSPEGRAVAAERATAAATPPLTSEEARQQARAEELMLRLAKTKTGFFGVHINNPDRPKPYKAQVSHGGKHWHLGSFATAEEAALCVARSLEARAAAQKAAAAPPLTSDDGDAGEEVKEEAIEVLDAIEVDVWTDDGDDEVQDLLGSGRERDE